MDDDELTAKIKAQVEEWSSNSNECFHIHLSQGSQSEEFQPEFTYPIFGEEEAIFGYQDLSIDLTFASHDLEPRLSVKYGTIFKVRGEVRPTDIKEALKEFLPAQAFSDAPLELVGAREFVPPGEKIKQYTRNGEQYEVWCASLADSTAKLLLQRMQILVPMFIEGGTTLQLEQDWTTQRWKLFLLYRVSTTAEDNASPYCLAGYGTSYRVFSLPDRYQPSQMELESLGPSSGSIDQYLPPPNSDLTNDADSVTKSGNLHSPLDLPSRERLSQFLILPPFQSNGHGQELYNAMYRHLTSPPNVLELTVEDPNEAFDVLRDVCDLRVLRTHSEDFRNLRININIPADKLITTEVVPTNLIVPLEVRTKIMKEYKINQRQFDRLVEMHTLSFIPPHHRSRNRVTRREKSSNEDDKAFYFWRLYVKQRLYVFNRDQLIQLEREDRWEKLEGAVDSVMEGYVSILERAEAQGGDSEDDADGEDGASMIKRKRKVIHDDEDSDGEGAGLTGAAVVTNGHKRARVEDE